MTSMTAPDTPLLAGRPMVNANSPEKSYIPHEDISDRQVCTVPGVNTGSSVSGHTPALASEAAATASICASTSIEQPWKKNSSVCCRSVPGPNAPLSRIE